MNLNVIFETRVGAAGLIFKENPFALVRVILPRPDRQTLLRQADKALWGKAGRHKNADMMILRLQDYFNGKPIEIPWEWTPLSDLTDLEQKVLLKTAEIPYGKTHSYKELAEAAGRPKACRFVGNVMAKNPFPVLIPCHRVIKSDGSIGHYGGGPRLKRAMLEMEGAF
jgi:methylated-DNA-[protein]-cysteine S-methyltransferase